MTATVDRPAPTASGPAPLPAGPLARAGGVELLGEVSGTGYRRGAALVRRADGQVLQLGVLMYGMLACLDGRRSTSELAAELSRRLGRRVGPEHVDRLAGKLARAGLLAGTEQLAPPRRNPLLALRWKVMVTGETATRRLTTPFVFLFRPWIVWPVVAAFTVVFWFVLLHKGVAGATAQAFHAPGWLLLVFLLTVVSAGFHELGHASACRYGGARPAGMGMGLYLVWPAFYTDVTDAYRLPRPARLRVDLAGLYFNAVIAVTTMIVWLVWQVDALLLLVGLQVLMMVQQLSPIIRADGYHILSDATGVPDLYAHLGPTLRRLLPWRRREPSALSGWARVLVTGWVLVLVPVLLSLLVSAVLVLPHLAASAAASGRGIVAALGRQATQGDALAVTSSLLQLLALAIPVAGSALITVMMVRSGVAKARSWSAGSARRRAVALTVGALVVAALGLAWWPAGQYQPVRRSDPGTLPALGRLIADQGANMAPVSSTRLALAMIPIGGASRARPALFLLPGADGKLTTELVSYSSGTGNLVAARFPFLLPRQHGPGDPQAVALGTHNGGVTYDIAYALITVRGGAPVTESNSAFAFATCRRCTTVAISFQVVLVVGHSSVVAPINAAGALNWECPQCVTTAIADQLVITLSHEPSKKLTAELTAALRRLDLLSLLGRHATPAALAADVAAVQRQVTGEIASSGLVTATPSPSVVQSDATPASPTPASTSNASPTTSASPVPSQSPSPAPSVSATPPPSVTPSP